MRLPAPWRCGAQPCRGFPRSLALVAVLALSACVRSAPPTAPGVAREELGEGPEIVEERPTAPAKRDILGSVSYDLPLEANRSVEAELDFLVGERSAVIRRWMERGDDYEAFIKQELRAAGLPTDLYHLALIESGMLPTARSRAGAVGFWQFMPATARAMGLRVDDKLDERMDPVRSTRAAARHLRGLHRQFGDWALAAAAYNAGSGRISRAMKKFGARNFWDLAERGDLAQETRHYVPRLYAMTIIARDRARFGFAAPATPPRFAYDSINVEYAAPLEELAKLGEPSVEQLRRLNPHLAQAGAPAGGYWVWVPQGTGVTLQRAWLASEFRRQQGQGTYAVRRGDNLGKLANLTGLSTARIRELNPGVEFEPLQIGVKLRLPYDAVQVLAARSEEGARLAAAEDGDTPTPKKSEKAGDKKAAAKSETKSGKEAPGAEGAKSHTVKQGETLWEIAQAYRVAVVELQEANKISGSNIRPGQKLRIPGGAKAAEAAPKAQPVEHVVKEGDTLWAIARKHGTSVDAIREANELGDRPIVPGQKLSIPAKQQ